MYGTDDFIAIMINKDNIMIKNVNKYTISNKELKMIQWWKWNNKRKNILEVYKYQQG